MSTYVHHIPGRLRIRLPAIKRNEAKAAVVRRLLEGAGGVRSVDIARLTGSVTVTYSPEATTGAALIETLRGAGYVNGDIALDRPQDYFSTQADKLGDEIGKAAMGFVVKKLLERSAVAVIGAIV